MKHEYRRRGGLCTTGLCGSRLWRLEGQGQGASAGGAWRKPSARLVPVPSQGGQQVGRRTLARLRRRRSPRLEDPSSRSHRTPSSRPHALKPSPLGVGLGRTDLGRHKHSVPDRSFVPTVRVDAPCHIRASNLRCPAQSHVPSPTERCAPWSGLLDL